MKMRFFLLLGLLALVGILVLFSNGCSKENPGINPVSTISDIDGNVYNKLTVGGQVWMKENLMVTQ
jgi:hypothetical protein